MSDSESQQNDVARTAGKAVDAARELGGFFGEVLGDGFRYLGGAFADWAAYYKYQNLISIRERLEQLRSQKGNAVTLIPIPPRIGIPLIDAASKEDNPDLQDMWAKLISNATDPERRFSLRRIYIETMSTLEPLDARILFLLNQKYILEHYDSATGRCLNGEEIAGHLKVDTPEVWASLTNLFRHGCIIDFWEQKLETLERGYAGFRVRNDKSNFRLSYLGEQLIEACT